MTDEVRGADVGQPVVARHQHAMIAVAGAYTHLLGDRIGDCRRDAGLVANDSQLGKLARWAAVGDQLRARGTRTADGRELSAEEIVYGAFRNIAGNVSSVDAMAARSS